jgi:hypothetical protein
MVVNQNTFLVIEPLGHMLEYGSCVLAEVVREGRRPGQTVVELRGNDARPDMIDAGILQLDPEVIVGIGHGDYSVYTVECKQRYLETGSFRVKMLKDRIVHLNSCRTAVSLGRDIAKVAKAYFGSLDDFFFYIGSSPCSDRASRATFLAEYEVLRALLEGVRDPVVIQSRRIEAHRREIEYWTVGPGRERPEAPIIARLLTINLSVSAMYTPETAEATPGIATAVIPVAVAVVTVLLYPRIETMLREVGR